jgi:hypothetical protein
MTEDYERLADRARAALAMAAMRRSVVTYGELAAAIGLSGDQMRGDLRHVLDLLAERCLEAGEPSLAALVVNRQTGDPGPGFSSGYESRHTEAQDCFLHWSSQG